MSQVTTYSDYYTQMLTDLPGAKVNLLLQALQRMGREFARKTQSFREELDPIAVVDYQQDYVLTHAYEASIHRIKHVKINQAKQKSNWFELLKETDIRFVTGHTPNANLADMLLTCGTIGTATIGDWTSISAGSLGASINGSTYSMTDIDFTADVDFDDVALTIQTALRVAIGGNVGFVRPIYNSSNVVTKFVIYVEGGTISYITAGSEGTDISGAGYMNGLTGTGVLSPMIQADVIFRPDINTDTMPDWYLDRWGEAIVAGATWWMARQTSSLPWSDPVMAADRRKDYDRGVTSALAENNKRSRNGVVNFDLEEDDFSADYYEEGRIENWKGTF